MANPLIAPWPGPYGGVPPWDQVRAEDFPAAFSTALAEERAAVEDIARNPSPPDFENTVAALQRVGRTKNRVLRLFGVMRHYVSTPEYRAIDREWQPRLAAAADEVLFCPGLFERIDAVYRSLAGTGLRHDQTRLTKLLWERCVRHGAEWPAPVP